jgi:hypothetical protein
MSGLSRLVLGSAVVVAAACSNAPVDATEDEWTMPNLVGKDLQSAQDAIQSLTEFAVTYTDSTDLSGQDRMQVSDRHWVVCTLTPPPGEKFTADTEIDFGVVRIEETCP